MRAKLPLEPARPTRSTSPKSALAQPSGNLIGERFDEVAQYGALTRPELHFTWHTGLQVLVAELGYLGAQGEHMLVLENDAEVHNLVVCTLCSCYPWPVLGLPPVWYKSAPYRSRAVIDPRGVLRESQ